MAQIRIDAHTHVSSLVLPSQRVPPPAQGYAELLLELLNEAEMEKAVLLPIAPWDSNEMIAAHCARYKERFIGFASVDPNAGSVFDPGAPVRQLQADIEKYALAGVKLNPRVQNFSLRDPRVIPIFQCAASRKIPVLVDGVVEVSALALDENLPFALDRLLLAVPDVRVIYAHMGGLRILDAYALAVTHQNLYLDLSAILYLYQGSTIEQDMRFVIKKLAPLRKLIYGSDFPMMDENKQPWRIKTSAEYYEQIFDDLRLDQPTRSDIMGGTIACLLDL